MDKLLLLSILLSISSFTFAVEMTINPNEDSNTLAKLNEDYSIEWDREVPNWDTYNVPESERKVEIGQTVKNLIPDNKYVLKFSSKKNKISILLEFTVPNENFSFEIDDKSFTNNKGFHPNFIIDNSHNVNIEMIWIQPLDL